MRCSSRLSIIICIFVSLWTGCCSANNATIGVLVYINSVAASSGLNRAKLIFQQLASSILLAINHINTRNNSVVGEEALLKIPKDFLLQYKIADTHSQQVGTVKALLDWRCEQGTEDYNCGTDVARIFSNATQTSPLYQSKSSDRIIGIVGPFRSEESQAVSNLASALGMTNFPVTSYASVLTELSDKDRYPYFSRTVPSLGYNAQGITKVFKKFGWTRCALLYIDDPWGNSFASDFFFQAGASGILVLASVKFKDLSVSDVRSAVEVVRASGASIFVYLEDTGNNLEAALLHAAEAKIAGRDGYAWVTFEQNDPEVQLSRAKTPPAQLRPLLHGWLNIFGYSPPAEQLARFQRVFATADRAALHHPLVDMPPEGFDSATLTAYHLYAYDSVWATAIGIAGARPDRADLVDRIRQAAFAGASGAVALDNATGDRLTTGLQLRVHTVAADLAGARFADANWSAARLVSQRIGYWEDPAGFFMAPGATPVWPGGRASWDAPVDGDVGTDKVPLILEIALPILACSVLLLAAAWWACRCGGEDDADRRLSLKVAELRRQLRITQVSSLRHAAPATPTHRIPFLRCHFSSLARCRAISRNVASLSAVQQFE
jgi:ABC-type branched-subunit amino acid transport system substrate-binding protein